MDNYKNIAVIGKGAYGKANLVQSLIDEENYIMKVEFHWIKHRILRGLDHRFIENERNSKAKNLWRNLDFATIIPSFYHEISWIVSWRVLYMINKVILTVNSDNLCIIMDFARKGDIHSFISNLKKSGKGLFP